MPKPKFTIGADPEVTLVDNDNTPVAAFKYLTGTKVEPEKMGDNFGCLWDNVNAEFLVPPARSFKEFSLNIKTGLNLLGERVSGLHGLKPVKIAQCASVEFPTYELQNKWAQEFGCDPDFNAWTKMMNEPPADPKNLRSAGGHVHIGYDRIENVLKLVRALDVFLGVPSVLLDPDTRRRGLYGKAGCFREKDYGVEYRVLSNFWIFNPTFHRFVYRGVQKAIEFHHTERSQVLMNDERLAEAIQHIINNSDVELAKEHNKLWGIKVS